MTEFLPLLLLVALAAVSMPADAAAPPVDTEIVASPNGDDAAEGTALKPVTTPHRAQKSRPAGLANNPGYLPEAVAGELAAKCSGDPVLDQRVRVAPGVPFELSVPMNENDVYFVTVAR